MKSCERGKEYAAMFPAGSIRNTIAEDRMIMIDDQFLLHGRAL